MAVEEEQKREVEQKESETAPSAFALRWRAFVDWIDTHRWHSAVIGFLLLFVGGIVGGYWIAGRLDGSDRDKIARDALEDMKRNEQAPPRPIYARIEDIPGLPHYTETEPGQKIATVEEKPRTRPSRCGSGG